MLRNRQALDTAVKGALLAALYVGTAKVGLMLDAVNGFAAAVWPPTGIALAALLLFGNRLWLGVWVGAFVVNAWTGAHPAVAAGIACGNTLEAVLGAYLLRRLGPFEGSFDRLRQVLALLVPVALGSTLLSATIGVTSLWLGGMVSAEALPPTWRSWWIGDTLGDLVVGSLLLTWARPLEWKWTAGRLAELVLLGGGVLGAGAAVFFKPQGTTAYPLGSPYVLFPFFVWAALRFGLQGGATVTALASAEATLGTVLGFGPFARETLAANLLSLQTFVGFAALTPLVVGGIVTDDKTKESASRQRIEDALLRSESKFRRLADSGILGIITADFQGDILDANEAFLKMVGYTSDEVLSGKVRWADMTPPEWRYLDERAIEQLKATRVATPWEKEYLRKDGTRLPILVGVALLDGTGETGVAFILDISDRKHAEAAIECLRAEREAELKASIQARDDFLSIAGHELRTPLSAMLMQIQAIERYGQKDPARMGERLARAGNSGLRLARLINQLLDVSRISTGTLRLEPERVNLSDVVRDVVTRFLEASASCPIAIHDEGPVFGLWDRLRLEQVVDNLVGNALKYGQGKPIDVSLESGDAEALLRVIDHGIGIDEGHQKRIFQRFERAVATRDFGGFGLGLWISRQIVEASGGTIQVESMPGEGSIFTVHLPMAASGSIAEDRSAG
jgi:PAS domain S-box-containing protein